MLLAVYSTVYFMVELSKHLSEEYYLRKEVSVMPLSLIRSAPLESNLFLSCLITRCSYTHLLQRSISIHVVKTTSSTSGTTTWITLKGDVTCFPKNWRSDKVSTEQMMSGTVNEDAVVTSLRQKIFVMVSYDAGLLYMKQKSHIGSSIDRVLLLNMWTLYETEW